MPEGIYHGRLLADGNGNLLADDDGESKGMPVRYHDGSYIFVTDGVSHNETHEENKLEMTGTVDESMTDDESLVNAYEGGENSHHFDPPSDPGVEPDAVAAKSTGHTDAWSGSSE